VTRALITGGAGFIGCHLARALLAQGGGVTLVDDFSRGASDEAIAALLAAGAVLHDRDLRQPDAFAGLPRDISHVFHLAAIVGVRQVLDRPYAVLRDNVSMLEGTLAFARTLPHLERVVFASTSEVYAGTLRAFTLPIPTPEDTPLAAGDLAQPRTSYMLSKIYGEALCHHAGLPFTIVRPHNVYGPRMGMSHVVPELLAKAWAAPQGGTLEVYSPTHRRTFCYVDDAVEMIRVAALRPAGRGATLNVGAAQPEITMAELAGLIARTVGKALEIVPLPATPGSPERRCPDMTRTAALTGCTARTSLADGLRATSEWYRHRLATP
jgi:nucleoside-diphosphate-sugar epimerase